MNYLDIIHRDPYLAGYEAARSYEWWDGTALGPEAIAWLCGLVVGDSRYADFLRGWKDCLDEVEIDRLKAIQEQRLKEGEKGFTHGDPEIW